MRSHGAVRTFAGKVKLYAAKSTGLRVRKQAGTYASHRLHAAGIHWPHGTAGQLGDEENQLLRDPILFMFKPTWLLSSSSWFAVRSSEDLLSKILMCLYLGCWWIRRVKQSGSVLTSSVSEKTPPFPTLSFVRFPFGKSIFPPTPHFMLHLFFLHFPRQDLYSFINIAYSENPSDRFFWGGCVFCVCLHNGKTQPELLWELLSKTCMKLGFTHLSCEKQLQKQLLASTRDPVSTSRKLAGLDKLLLSRTPFSHSSHPFSVFVLISNYQLSLSSKIWGTLLRY